MPQIAPFFGLGKGNTIFDGPGEDEDFGLEQVSGLNYIGIVFPDAAYLAEDSEPGLRAGWTLQALGTLPLGQYRQPILCFAHEGFAVQRYLQG